MRGEHMNMIFKCSYCGEMVPNTARKRNSYKNGQRRFFCSVEIADCMSEQTVLDNVIKRGPVEVRREKRRQYLITRNANYRKRKKEEQCLTGVSNTKVLVNGKT